MSVCDISQAQGGKPQDYMTGPRLPCTWPIYHRHIRTRGPHSKLISAIPARSFITPEAVGLLITREMPYCGILKEYDEKNKFLKTQVFTFVFQNTDNA